MTDLTSRDNIIADLIDITIDSDTAPYHGYVKAVLDMNPHPVTSGRTGATVLKSIAMGVTGTVELEIIQCTIAEFQKFEQIAGSAPRKHVGAGTVLTQHTMTLHPQAAGAITTGDLFLYAVSFGKPFDMQSDGKEHMKFKVIATIEADASVDVSRRGAGT